jgi:aldehyde dehydrogenase (NAD+)
VYKTIFESQKKNFENIKLSSFKERIVKLKCLKSEIEKSLDELYLALEKDLRKSPVEAELLEVYPVFAEIDFAIKNLKRWMKPHKVKSPLALIGSRSEIRYEPKGVVLIIGPWNYPLQLMIIPLVSAIAAGNAAILKPSEMCSHTSRYLVSLISRLFDKAEVACIEGDASVSEALLQLPFDHIFFTGSARVGKMVMSAAARHLTSVTLELGGKSPAIIDRSADLRSAAKRIVWGKFINAGQTCVAPDFVFVPEENVFAFVEEAKREIQDFYGPTEEDRERSPDLARVINDAHYLRLKSLINGALIAGAKLEIGGIFNDKERYVAPTLLTNIQHQFFIMKEEIFGPILPIITYKSLNDVYGFLIEKPLALYVFSKDKEVIEDILTHTNAGGTAINNTVLQLSNPNLPFGGQGASGAGSYHGFFGFKAFSHERAIYTQGRLFFLQALYPPYTKVIKKMVRLLLKYLTR